MKNIICNGVILFLICGCHSPSDEILDKFKKVNASLEKPPTRELVSRNSFELYYSEIKRKGDARSAPVKNAGSLYAATKKTDALIESIKKTLETRDSIGDNTTISKALLVDTQLGDSLVRMLIEVSARCYSSLITASKKSSLDSALTEIRAIRSQPNWLKSNFSDAPSVAVVTILAYFQMELEKASTITLADIDGSLK